MGSPGDALKVAHSPQPQELGSAVEQQHSGDTASGTLPSLLCACCHVGGWSEGYSQIFDKGIVNSMGSQMGELWHKKAPTMAQG